jgi:hypothetical protein
MLDGWEGGSANGQQPPGELIFPTIRIQREVLQLYFAH